MSGWTHHTGNSICLPIDNIDTDQLIPARFMSQSRADGYGDFLFHDLRRRADDTLDTEFVFNRVSTASILVTGHNFGCGSSREAAVYALVDAGLKVVVASSFADIFAANAVNNGLLPARVSVEDLARWHVEQTQLVETATVNLTNQSLVTDHATWHFELDASSRTKLINGWDDIDLTSRHADRIAAFRQHRHHQHSWVFIAQTTGEDR